jgi:hypothetical protein
MSFVLFFIFENKKKSHRAISGEFGEMGMTTELFLAKKLRTSNDAIQQFWNGFCCHSFHA